MIIKAIAGSFRKKSYNKMALKYMVQGAKEAGADVEIIDLNDYPMPIYDEDTDKAGKPENVLKLKEKLAEAKGLLIATPEYNHSLPGGFKNVIDWLSRFKDQPFKGKWIALGGASTSSWGTVRAQLALLPVFRVLAAHVLPTQIYMPLAQNLFDDEGNIKDEAVKNKLIALGKELVEKLK
ncbi:MAG: NAD(P)H-dependent oxidoreductase [Ignavibacteria bacterium]|nr:NAD(P)H-dependent oxidoreductase [Ignavibacteria bacterium]